MSILNNWNTKQKKEPLLAKVKDKVTPQPPLRNRVETTQRAMQTLISRLDQKQSRLKTHDTALFDKVVEATQKHDKNRAAAYANELAELRKITSNVTQMRLVLEQINLRMGTVQDFGDIVTSITPIASVIKGMRSSMSGILPEASSEMSEIGEMMNGLIADAGQFGGTSPLIESSGAETNSILAEAAAVAEVNDEEKFPSPSTTSTPTAADDFFKL
jgi:division protein CdvB (Snf7/Vps24/ESCRT-III family)|tara:strand:- start:2576 stop:3223 length:648 start_codon:yes stop_codon:yes gene_type:complete